MHLTILSYPLQYKETITTFIYKLICDHNVSVFAVVLFKTTDLNLTMKPGEDKRIVLTFSPVRPSREVNQLNLNSQSISWEKGVLS